MQNLTDYYIYIHSDKNDVVRYVGKGRRSRAWMFCQRSKRWNKVFGQNEKPKVSILESGLDEWTAFQREAFYISKFLDEGCHLINIAGGGPSGWDDRAKSILSEMRSGENAPWYGKKRDPETVQKGEQTKRERGSHTRYWAGKKRDPELIAKLIASGSTPEARAKQKESLLKRDLSWSEERKKKVSEKMTGYDFGPDHGEKISKAKKGRPNGLLGRKIPEETKKKMSEAAMGRVYGKEVTDKTRATKLARGNTTKKAKQIECVETQQKFRCATDAANDMFEGKGFKVIQQVCSGAKKSYRGYTFRYV